jgi:hypothetical protein
MAENHFRSDMDARQEPFRVLFPLSQCIVQKGAEVGLDDL